MNRSAEPYIRFIWDALVQLEEYRPETYDLYMSNHLAQDAILMRLFQIGENLVRIRRLDIEAFSEHAPESWHKLIGLRNVISHGYEDVNPEQIWSILTAGLAEFAATLENMDLLTGLPLADG
ncbi:MAG: DUF86 domain-containing protein [Thermomicrobiales bacterium]|jgi:uncharacterized protein with HEPN domain|nr:DUF86 domain-containing protein [Thermomicrobiales bacterium]